MNALIPDKDTLFLLSKIQKDFIKKYNLHFFNSLIPLMPLWAFTEEEKDFSFFKDFSKVIIEKPLQDENIFFFPVKVIFSSEKDSKDFQNSDKEDKSEKKDKIFECRILFARIKDEETKRKEENLFNSNSDFSFSREKDFPLNSRIFRMGKIELNEEKKENIFKRQWKLYGEKWFKAKKK